jgi:hypothetical protein
MVYLRELPVPLKEADPLLIDLFFDFATTYTEESVLAAQMKMRREAAAPPADVFRELGYTEKAILGMDI